MAPIKIVSFALLSLVLEFGSAAAVPGAVLTPRNTAVSTMDSKAYADAWSRLESKTRLVDILGLDEGEQVPEDLMEEMLGTTPANPEDSLVGRATAKRVSLNEADGCDGWERLTRLRRKRAPERVPGLEQ